MLPAMAAALFRYRLLQGAMLRDLAAHKPKDLGRPDLSFELAAEGVEVDFPPIRSPGKLDFRNSLPGCLGTSVGSKEEITGFSSLAESSSLVMITGGSVGYDRARLAGRRRAAVRQRRTGLNRRLDRVRSG
jgi:hypothetical protein